MLSVQIVERMLPGQLMQHYLMASYCYYQLNESPMADSTYDRLCKLLREVHPTLEHQHAHLVTDDDLAAGTCLLREEQYPRMVHYACICYEALCHSGQMERMLEPHLKPVAPQRPTRVTRTPPAAITRVTRTRPAPAAPAPVLAPPTARRITRTRPQ